MSKGLWWAWGEMGREKILWPQLPFVDVEDRLFIPHSLALLWPCKGQDF